MSLDANAMELVAEADRARADADELFELAPHAGADSAEMLRDAQAAKRVLEKRRTDITGPLMTAKKRIDELFKPALQRLEQVVDVLRRQVAAELLGMRQVQHAAIAAGDIATAQRVQEEAPRVTTRKALRYRVVDATLIPRQYLAIQETAVYAALKAGTDIPGIEGYYEEVVIAR